MEDATRRDAQGGDPGAQYALSQIEFKRGNKREALSWLEKSVAHGFSDACYSMAMFQIAGISVPFDAVGARRNLRTAADQGHADAGLILSQLVRSGFGGSKSGESANALLVELAERGHPMALCGVAMLLHVRGQLEGAVEIFLERAALKGSHVAAYIRAEMRRDAMASGDLRARDERIKYLFLSARAGNRLAEAELTENEKSVVRGILDRASFSPTADSDVIFEDVAEALNQPFEHVPDRPEILSSECNILKFRNFLTPVECSYIKAAAAPGIQPSSTVHPHTGELIKNEIRTSSSSNFDPVSRDHFIFSVDERIAAATDTIVEQGEPLNVLYYRIAEEYKFHYDFLSANNEEERRLLKEGGQRKFTFLISLNEEYSGGETYFPRLDVKYRGQLGDALMFQNTGVDGQPNELMLHAGMPITCGQKWVASKWIREEAFTLGAPARM